MNFGRYQVIKELGRGSMGVVYQAHDPNLDLTVALKVLRQDRGDSTAFTKRFLREAKALGRLDHPNIIRVFNVDEAEGNVYIAMEFIEGESLDKVMAHKKFTADEVIELGITIAETLNHAHEKGIVHRDIKPSNILVRSDGRIKITDFGIAHLDDPTASIQTQAGEILGTPAYMSPEQILSRPVDGRSDLFSAGIILYELSVGIRPFGGDSLAAIFNSITQNDPPLLKEVMPSLPEELSLVITKCLQRNPDDRFKSGQALAEALKKRGEKIEEATIHMAPAEQNKPKKTGLIVFTALVIIIAVGLTYFFFMKPKSESLSEELQKSPAAEKETAEAPPAKPETPQAAEKRLTKIPPVETEPSQSAETPPAKPETPQAAEKISQDASTEIKKTEDDLNEWIDIMKKR
ncbi:MAG: protein kinase [Nitrospirae bacterium]|nr:protein kinase [Nitrospirota bacterium]